MPTASGGEGSPVAASPGAAVSSEVVAKVMATVLELDGERLTVKECYPLEVSVLGGCLVGWQVGRSE